MFEKNDKRRLEWLIDLYLSGKMKASNFCDEFCYCYGQELDRKTVLTTQELKIYDELDIVTGRFSQYEEDHKLDPKAFFTEEQLKLKVIQTKEKLNALKS